MSGLRVGDHVQYIRKNGDPSTTYNKGEVKEIIGTKAVVHWHNVTPRKWFNPPLTQLRKTEMQFQPGYRVRYTKHSDLAERSGLFGAEGVVRHVYDTNFAKIKWDDPDVTTEIVNTSNITRISTEEEARMEPKDFQPGDRVEYIGPASSCAGDVGTVESVHGDTTRYRVNWDKGSISTEPRYALRKTDARFTVEAALAFLRAKGQVKFTPKWEDIALNDNPINGYTPIVKADHIKVGCQNVSFKTFDAIADAVAKAKAFNKENGNG